MALIAPPGIRDDLVNAGATWLDEPVVADGNLLTSRGPQDLAPFVRALVDFFAASSHDRTLSSDAARSAPQRDRPPSVVIAAMRWLPRPSLRAAIGVLAVVIGIGAIARARLAGIH